MDEVVAMPKIVQYKDKVGNKVFPNNYRRIATATISSSVSMAEGVANINLTSINSNTSKLTLSNGGIRIGAGIKKILVGGGAFVDTANGGGYNWLRVSKNSSSNSVATCLVSGGMIYKQANISPRPVDVVEGDIIYLTNDVAGAGTPYTIRTGTTNTYLMVEIIESN